MEDGVTREDISRHVLCIVSKKTSLGRLQSAFDDSGLKHPIYQTRPRCSNTLAVPTRLPADNEGYGVATAWLAAHDTEAHVECVDSSFFTARPKKAQASPGAKLQSILDSSLAGRVSSSDIISLRSELPTSFAIYGSLLLFPPGSCTTPGWQSPRLISFWKAVCKSTGVTHVAANAPIARSKFNGVCSTSSTQATIQCPPDRPEFSNVIRSPTSLLPLHGDFGPPARTDSVPTSADFRAAYWTETKQNGIVQVWAPLYTMFSAGNHKEKARVLHLPSVALAVAEGRENGQGCAVVDLFVGIGYFAFSYLKAGVDLVIGWDLNPWSIEGLRRGAVKNKWVACAESQDEFVEAKTRLLAFIGDNAAASTWIQDRRSSLPSIRHVNLGLLPTSRGSWSVALDVLDKTLGGWLHIHENFGAAELDARSQDVQAVLESLVAGGHRWPDNTRVVLEQIFKVKSFAPGVYHCVLDFRIDVSSHTIDICT